MSQTTTNGFVNYFQQLFDSLALSESNGLYITSSQRHEVEGVFSKKVEQNIDSINPYAFFIFNKEPLILFFDETQNNTRTHQLCWNFNVTPIIFFVSETDINIYNGFELDNANLNNPLLKQIASGEQKDSFSFWHITSGQTFEEYTLNTKKRVDKQLLANIKVSRAALINSGLQPTLANNLIGRLIFVRYLIDREVQVGFSPIGQGNLDRKGFLEIIQDKNGLYGLFKHLKDKFKGDLFPIQEKEIDNLEPQHLNILYRLFNGDDLGSGQISLFQVYNFKILPTEFISNIYEYFMGDEKKKSHKSYYTPSFLVNYILNETVSTYFDNHPTYDSCKVIDPTCGSGIFLVEAYRRIVNQYEKLHGKITNGNRHKLKYLLQENIYGIDKDPDAVNVAIFSLYITLLDYQEPKEIETFEFPNLLNTNFFVQDIFDFYEATLFENWKDENYTTKLYNTQFQFIIGNPPWGKVPKSPFLNYVKKRAKKEKRAIQIETDQFAQAFLIRTSDFCRDNTICAVVINSKTLYNRHAKYFRSYFLNNFYLDRIFEMSPIRKDVFNSDERTAKGAISPASVLFYRYSQNQSTFQNDVTHVSAKYNTFYNLLKLLVIEKNDIKKLKQVNFIKNDWIWKVLLYGNVLDYQFVKRLNNDYQSIKKFINDSGKFLVGDGVKMNKGKKDAAHLIGKPFLDISIKQSFNPFRIKANSVFNRPFVESCRNPVLFQAPMLLIKDGLTADFQTSSAVSKQNIVFGDSLTSIKAFDSADIIHLHCLMGVYHSKLYNYFQINTASNPGVERERLLQDEMLSFPYLYNENISQFALQIETKLAEIQQPVNFYKIIDEGANLFVTYEQANEIRELYQGLNSEVNELYDVNVIEESLIDYAEKITIPLIKNDNKVFAKASTDREYLKKYATVFFAHFGKIFDGRRGRHFEVEIRHSRFFVCMVFKVVEHLPKETIYFNSASSLDMSFFSKLAIQEVSEKLYVQKDIKVFRGSEFYIIKPNEMKCWHTAIAHSDLFEIREAIMKQSNPEPATT